MAIKPYDFHMLRHMMACGIYECDENRHKEGKEWSSLLSFEKCLAIAALQLSALLCIAIEDEVILHEWQKIDLMRRWCGMTLAPSDVKTAATSEDGDFPF